MTGITLLAAERGKRTAKTFTDDGVEPFEAGWRFQHKWFDLRDLDHLQKVLEHYADPEKRMLAIRGKVADGAPDWVRRSKLDNTERYGANFGRAWVGPHDQRWVMIDLDGVELGSDDDPRDVLPAEFDGVACILQHSSSSGLRPGFHAHLWFWLDRDVCDASLKEWLEDTAADAALFDPVQAHYFAHPTFEGARVDPIEERITRIDGDECVSLPDCVLDQADYDALELSREAAREAARREHAEKAATRRAQLDDLGADTQAAVDAWLDRDMRSKLDAMVAAPEGVRHETIIKAGFYIGAQSQGDPGWLATGVQLAESTGSHGAARTFTDHFHKGAATGEQFVPTLSVMHETGVVDEAIFSWDEPAAEQAATLEQRVDNAEHCEWLLGDDVMDVLASLDETDPVRLAVIKRKAKGKVGLNDFRAALKRAKARRRERTRGLEPVADGPLFERGDHTEVAEFMLARHGERPVFDLGALHVYGETKGTWSPLSVERVRSDVGDLAESGAFVEAGENVKSFTANRDTQKGVAETMFDRTDSPEFFVGKRAIAFENGTAVVDEAECRVIIVDHEPALGARWGFDFALERDAESERLSEFFADVWEGVPDVDERVRLMQEFLGCTLFGVGSREQKALLLLGPAGTGKSTVLNVCRSVLPDEAVTAIPPHHWGDDNKIAQLARARANLVYETPRDYLPNVERIKEVIDGAPITTREAYGRAFTFAPDCVHLFAANRLPEAPGGPDFFDRFILLDLKRRFRGTSDERRDMAAWICEERAGIVAWCVRGVERFLEQGGYTTPASSLRMLADWESEIDSVNQWVTELCGRDLPDYAGNKSDYRTVRDTYQAYRSWCVLVGRSPVGEKEFVSRLEARGIDKSRMAKGYVLPILRDAGSDVISFP